MASNLGTSQIGKTIVLFTLFVCFFAVGNCELCMIWCLAAVTLTFSLLFLLGSPFIMKPELELCAFASYHRFHIHGKAV